jgi:hypothetical protein
MLGEAKNFKKERLFQLVGQKYDSFRINWFNIAGASDIR